MKPVPAKSCSSGQASSSLGFPNFLFHLLPQRKKEKEKDVPEPNNKHDPFELNPTLYINLVTIIIEIYLWKSISLD